VTLTTTFKNHTAEESLEYVEKQIGRPLPPEMREAYRAKHEELMEYMRVRVNRSRLRKLRDML
jgi:cell wall assembly regulator SMI1